MHVDINDFQDVCQKVQEEVILWVKKNILSDEVAVSSEKQKYLEEKLFKIFANEAYKRLGNLRTENCFGCLNDRPSQKDHDLCLQLIKVDSDYYVDLALSQVDGTKAVQYWREAINHDIKPPLNELELLKYNSRKWIEETSECSQGQKSIKKLMFKKLKEEYHC